MKKVKDCNAVVKNVLDDIASRKEEMALKKLLTLQKDGIFLVDATEKLAEWLEAVDKHYQIEDAELLRQIGDLNQQEDQLKSQKRSYENDLAAQQNVLSDNQNNLSSAEDSLRDAEHKRRRAEEEEKERMLTGSRSIKGGALLGLLTGADLAVGAAAGAGIGATVNACKDEEKDARAVVNCHRNGLDNARTLVNEGISNIESQIRSKTIEIECKKQQHLQLHNERNKIKAIIVLVKKSVEFWLLFKQISEHGVNRTELLQKIVTRATEKGNYQALQSKSSQRIATTFIEAWEEMETMAEQGGSNHILENTYKCSQCTQQYTDLPYVYRSTLVCLRCYIINTL